MFKTGFLAQRNLPPVVLPGVRDPYLVEQLPPPDEPSVAVPVEGETESSRLSLEEEIDEFYFEEEVQQAPWLSFLILKESRTNTPQLVLP